MPVTHKAKQSQSKSRLTTLNDGTRIRFHLKERNRDPNYSVSFCGPKGRLERSTKEKNLKRAEDAAVTIIRQTYKAPEPQAKSWDDALDLIERHQKAANLRPDSIYQNKLVINLLRENFPDSFGPSDITPALAEEFKVKRIEQGIRPVTVEGNIKNLSTIYGKWLKRTCRIVAANPFEEIEPPKYDLAPPRIVAPKEKTNLEKYLSTRWGNWRLPVLFLEVKSALGCRIGELTKVLSNTLKDGRLTFVNETTKGRKQRSPLLPPALYAELKKIAGKTYLWERFSDELRQIHRDRQNPHNEISTGDFTPTRLKKWMQREVRKYFQKTKKPRYKLHNFRGTAMSRAKEIGIPSEEAALAFGCDPKTMQRHYEIFDEKPITDAVYKRLYNGKRK